MEQYFSSRFSGKFPGAKECLKQVVMFFPVGTFQTEIHVSFLQSQL